MLQGSPLYAAFRGLPPGAKSVYSKGVQKPLTEPRVPRSEKVAFILSQRPDLSAREVVDRAKSQGLELTEQRVHTVRSLARHQGAKRMSKTTFGLGLAEDLPAKEVISRARAAGLEISEDQVHNIRWAARRKQRLGGTPMGRFAIEVVPTLPSKQRKAQAESDAPAKEVRGRGVNVEVRDTERKLKRLIAEVGINRTRELLDEVEDTFAA
jgi:hypothetical protein